MNIYFFSFCLIFGHSALATSPLKVFQSVYKDRLTLQNEDPNRIVNGADASRNQFPFQLSLQWDYGLSGLIWSHICGATIISPTFSLTAAHCIVGSGDLKVVAGLLNQGENTDYRQDVLVSQYFINPYYPGGNVAASGDIALLKLTSSLTWTNAVQPAGLPTQNSVPSGYGYLTGWGYFTSSGTLVSTTLQYALLPVITNSECENTLISILGTSEPLDDTMFCTGSTTDNVSSCNGDSGGPLSQNGVIIGVTSWGVTPCGWPNAPTAYTKVSLYTSWINQYVTDL